MKIKRVLLTEEPYPACIVSGKQLGPLTAVFEVTREDDTIVYVDVDSYFKLNKEVK